MSPPSRPPINNWAAFEDSKNFYLHIGWLAGMKTPTSKIIDAKLAGLGDVRSVHIAEGEGAAFDKTAKGMIRTGPDTFC